MTVSFFLMILLVHQTIGIQSGYGETKAERQQKRAAEIKSRVEGLGVGAVVAVYREDGIKEQGQITEISDSTFKLLHRGSTKSISYGSASGIRLVKPNYKANGATDPVRVRQSVVNLGLGNNAMVRTRGERLKGKIQSIDRENFTILSSSAGQPRVVSFSEVTEIKGKAFPAWATGAIVAGIVAGLAMGVMLAACGTGGC
jgi:sRNA-binding regulator protein Hfq